MKRRAFYDKGSLATELAGLPDLDREELVERWRRLYGIEPPVKIRNNFLIRAIAYRLQEQALGGLKLTTKQFLKKSAGDTAAVKPPSLPIVSLKPGTRLLREWHGVTYEVIVLEDGMTLNGKHYRSLSEVAKAITGTPWSGPRFFGLKKRTA